MAGFEGPVELRHGYDGHVEFAGQGFEVAADSRYFLLTVLASLPGDVHVSFPARTSVLEMQLAQWGKPGHRGTSGLHHVGGVIDDSS